MAEKGTKDSLRKRLLWVADNIDFLYSENDVLTDRIKVLNYVINKRDNEIKRLVGCSTDNERAVHNAYDEGYDEGVKMTLFKRENEIKRLLVNVSELEKAIDTAYDKGYEMGVEMTLLQYNVLQE